MPLTASGGQTNKKAAEAEPGPVYATYPPQFVYGSRILLMQKYWLDKIMASDKTMEIRHMRYRPGIYFLGCKGKIYGWIKVGETIEIATVASWKELMPRHQWTLDRLPYKATYGLPIEDIGLCEGSYQHNQGAQGLVVNKTADSASLPADPLLSSQVPPGHEEPMLSEEDEAETEIQHQHVPMVNGPASLGEIPLEAMGAFGFGMEENSQCECDDDSVVPWSQVATTRGFAGFPQLPFGAA